MRALLLASPALALAAVGGPGACGAGCAASQEHLLLQSSRPALTQYAASTREPDQIFFDAVVRDFTADHPDFQAFDGHFTGLVGPRLGADGKPVFRGGPVLSTQGNFEQWYHDVPGVNQRLPLRLVLSRSAKGTYVYESDSFFPVDGRGWKDSAIALDGKPHNFYFTLEMKSSFVYQGGEEFQFRGDDDVWVFMNGELVMDLGGVHNPLEGSVALDDLGLRKGDGVELHFFFAERRCCGSNFRIETNIRFPTPERRSCVLWGDPHVSVFDRAVAEGTERTPPFGMYATGDFWLVKSGLVQIQGRYGSTLWTAAGQSALLALAVGGPFLQNHTLLIEPMDDDGQVTWDGAQILKAPPSEFFIKGFLNVSFHEGAGGWKRVIDPAQGHLPVRTVTARLPQLVDLRVNRWAKHIDAIITMAPQSSGQDGHCGNFNGDPLDDTKALILDRAGAAVLAGETLFPPWPQGLRKPGGVAAEQAELRLEDCEVGLRAQADRQCKAALGEGSGGRALSQDILEACTYDVCFGGKGFAAEDAAVEGLMEGS